MKEPSSTKGPNHRRRNAQNSSFMKFPITTTTAAILYAAICIPAACGQIAYKGVNLSGAEFGQQNLPGTYNGVGSGPYDYIYPPASEVNYFLDKGMNTFRLPFRWERLQQSVNADLHATELRRMNAFVNHATSRGGHVILDPHNFARYYGDVIDGGTVNSSHLADFWGKVANEYKDNPRVIFGLMNEPHSTSNQPPQDMSAEIWLSIANDSIAAIRDAGAQNLILVPGTAYTGAHSWDQNWYGTPNADAMGDVVDPMNNFAFDVHQYLDSDSSGSTSGIVNQNIGRNRLVDFTDWLKDNNFRGFLGEFAAANSRIGNGGNQIGDETIDTMLDYVEANDDVWMGYAWWGGGPWWGNYLFAIDPANGNDRPSMNLLEPRLTDANLGSPFLPGDYNDDGFVDAADFSVWRDNLGSDVFLPGDTSPGLVSNQDYQVWTDFFGTSRLSSGNVVAIVPEPHGAWMLPTMLVGILLLRRRW